MVGRSRLGGLKTALEKAAGSRKGREPVIAAKEPVERQKGGAQQRAGKIHVGAWLPPEYKTSLRMIQVKTNRSLQELTAEAFNELFVKYDVPTVEAWE
jgi:hypothetical protein